MGDQDFDAMLSYFTNFDSKNNGALDFDEFSKLIRDIGFKLSEEELKKGFDKVDIDNNNEIDFEEFMAWWGEQE